MTASEPWVNRERIIFAAAFILFALAAADYFGQPPQQTLPPPPTLSGDEIVAVLSQATVGEEAVIQAGGRDPFVPFSLTKSHQETTQPRRLPTAPVPVSPQAVVNPPPKPSVKPVPDAREAPPPEEKYEMPVEVKGITRLDSGEYVAILTKKGTGDYFTMGVGEEFDRLLIRKITPDSVLFENEKGDRFYIHLDDLRAEVFSEAERGGAAPTASSLPARTTPRAQPRPRGASAESGGAAAPDLQELMKNTVVKDLMGGKDPKTLSADEMMELMRLYRSNPALKELVSGYLKR